MSLVTPSLSPNSSKQKQCFGGLRSQAEQLSKYNSPQPIMLNNSGLLLNAKSNSCIINPKVLNDTKKILNRESYFNKQTCENNISCFKKPTQSNLINKSKITESQILNSSIYARLQQKIKQLVEVQNKQNQINHQNLINGLNEQILLQKKKLHHEKVKIWETKNSIVQLQQALREEQQMLKNQLEQLQYEGQEQVQQFGQFSDDQDCQQQETEYNVQSKPTCSINQFISQKTCEQGIQIYEGNDILPKTFTNKTYQERNFTKDNQENQSFKQIFKINSEKLNSLKQFNDSHIQPCRQNVRAEERDQEEAEQQDQQKPSLKKALQSSETNQQQEC